jgi:hypothetical protein
MTPVAPGLGPPLSVGTIMPVSVDDDLGRRGVTKKLTVIEGALVVAEDVLHDHEIGLTRVVHVKAHLLDCVGDVRPRPGYGRLSYR